MMLTLTLAAGLLAAPEPQAQPLKLILQGVRLVAAVIAGKIVRPSGAEAKAAA
jgi:hypothetical protein